MRFCDSHPLLFAMACMPFLMGGFLIMLGVVVHIINWTAKIFGNLIWECGLRLRDYWRLLNKTTIYYPDAVIRIKEPIFLPGALLIVLRLTLFYALAQALHAIIFSLLA